MDELDELVLEEGDEEVQYILLDLPDDAPASLDAPGTVLRLQGLETDEPLVVDENGTVLLRGRHQETLGSVLVMALGEKGQQQQQQGQQQQGQQQQQQGQGEGQQQQGGGGSGEGEQAAASTAAAGQQRDGESRRDQTRYLCHLEKRIVFSLPPQPPAAAGGGGLTAAGGEEGAAAGGGVGGSG